MAVPNATPVTTPVLLTEAIEVLELLHVPPETLSDSGVVEPAQTVVVPDILPAVGKGLTVTDDVALAVPQLLVTL